MDTGSKETKHIADSTFIDTRCKHWDEMIGNVDGVILARDDSKITLSTLRYF